MTNNTAMTSQIAGHVNKKLGAAEQIIKESIKYLEKNRYYEEAQELQIALIKLNSVDIEVKNA